MVSLCGRLTRTDSATSVKMKVVRRMVAATRNVGETSAAGNLASGTFDVAISLAPPGSHGPLFIRHRRCTRHRSARTDRPPYSSPAYAFHSNSKVADN